MSFLSKKDALASIKKRVQVFHGANYTIYEAYLGTNPFTRKAVRKYARSEIKLKKKIADFYTSLDTMGASGATLSPYQAMDAHQALDMLAHANIKLTLVECVRFTLSGKSAQMASAQPSFKIGDAYAKYLESVADKSEVYQKDIRSRVGKWVNSMNADALLSSVTAADVKRYLMANLYRQGDVGSWISYNNHLGLIKTFMAWCSNKGQGFIDENPIEGMKKITIPYRQPEYMKAAHVEGLFRELWNRRETHVGRADLAYAVLSFFCGMRQSEIDRVPLGEHAVRISLEERTIRIGIPKGVSKGIKPRAFVIPEQALAWMTAFDFMDGATMRNTQFRRHLVEAAEAANVKLPKNAGRHTFITMFEAVHHDAPALTAIVGNTDDVRQKNYNGAELAPEGRAYFAILPAATDAPRG